MVKPGQPSQAALCDGDILGSLRKIVAVLLRTLDCFVVCGGEPIELIMQGGVLGTMRYE